MTPRERFNAIMFYEEFDRVPVWHWTEWAETQQRWADEGLPVDGNRYEYFGCDPMTAGVPLHLGLLPGFEEETVEETDEYRIFRQADGVIAQHWKAKSCIPHYVDFILKDRQSWPEYKRRLQPDPARLPQDLPKISADLKATNMPVSVPTASLTGWLRDWMGVVGFSYIQHDDPELLGEMVNTIADLVCWGLDQVLPHCHADLGWGWEDICGKNGPLVSPRVFEEYVVPGYRKISDKLAEYGTKLHLTDCDGDIRALVPGWLRGGVNVMFPIEIGTWSADPMAFRQQYGRELRIIGGVDKLEIAKGAEATKAEIRRRLPLMRDGGFIPLPDHLIVPETSLADYRFYIECMKRLDLSKEDGGLG